MKGLLLKIAGYIRIRREMVYQANINSEDEEMFRLAVRKVDMMSNASFKNLKSKLHSLVDVAVDSKKATAMKVSIDRDIGDCKIVVDTGTVLELDKLSDQLLKANGKLNAVSPQQAEPTRSKYRSSKASPLPSDSNIEGSSSVGVTAV